MSTEPAIALSPLQRKRYSRLVRNAVYFGDDHLLLLKPLFLSVRYHAIPFSNIEAFTTRRTNMYALINLLALTFLFPALTGALYYFGPGLDPESGIGMLLLAAVPAAALIVNLLRGPTCVMHVHTAVGSVRVPGLGRTGTAARLFAKIGPLIEKAQSAYPPVPMDENRPRESWLVERYARPPRPVKEWRAAANGGSRFHEFYYWLSLAEGFLLLPQAFSQVPLVTLSGALAFSVVVTVVGVLAMIAQRKTRLSVALVYLTNGTVVLRLLFGFIAVYAAYMLALQPEFRAIYGIQNDFSDFFGYSIEERLFTFGRVALPFLVPGIAGLVFLYTDPWRRAGAVRSR